MSELTPGPWLYRGKSSSVHRTSDTHPFGQCLFQFRDEAEPNDADLALILAAPELLEALEAIAGFTLSQFAGPNDMALECVTLARAAIAKATGGEHD